MQTGKVLCRFTAKTGKEVVLRAPRWEDLDNLVEHINSLVDEGAEIYQDTKVTREQEAEWLGTKLANIEKKKSVFLVAEADRRVVGTSDVEKRRGPSNHVGDVGIAIQKDYRNIGIGTAMFETIIPEAKRMGVEILFLRAFSTNKAARHLYKKMGFKETGRAPKIFYKNGKYIDEVTMTKEI